MWKFVDAHRGTVYAVLTLVILIIAYKLLTLLLRRYLRSRAHKPENVQQFLLVWRYVWLGVGLIFLIVSFSGSLVSLGISAAFLGMILGWSLQAPVTGIAAWLMVIVKRPFKIGDRVIIAGIIGDVTDINLTHIVLNQVGGTIGGEEKSGRGVMIPNATLFQQIIYNYAMETRFILDEVPVMITFGSDLAEAKRILIEAAEEVTRDIIAETGQEPFTREEFTDWGIRTRVRYQAIATERQRISSEIVGIVFDRFTRSDKVRFCYPHSEILYHPVGQFDVLVSERKRPADESR
ncbi:MAG: hypothetical protein AMS16_02635 [Planctomycetes bacterium DG_58]|nr:MAG: hypothetical protein AMS16_02635 [Planctomycetes bacterium DG_58]KPK99903.1 MAG: hypothetical protein AMK75_06180 [Planctomycetes bacterium SM23_65]